MREPEGLLTEVVLVKQIQGHLPKLGEGRRQRGKEEIFPLGGGMSGVQAMPSDYYGLVID